MATVEKEEEEEEKEGKRGEKKSWGGWWWRELSSSCDHWELELSSEPPRFEHEWRFTCCRKA
jgi:hypothetical protein